MTHLLLLDDAPTVPPLPPVPYPGTSWPTGSPESVGMSSERLRAINPSLMGNAGLYRHGVECFTWGDAGFHEVNWASCARSYVTTAWGRAITEGRIAGGLAVLDQPVRDLPSATAQKFASGIRLKHLLSYTSQANPPGSSWSYSSGSHWPRQHRILAELLGEEVADYMNDGLLQTIGGPHAVMTSDDRTMRVHGSARRQARWGYLWLHAGRWKDRQLVDAEFVRRSVAGGPNGDGQPNQREAYQIHLVRDEQWWEGPVPNVPDDCFFALGGSAWSAGIFCVPSLDLVLTKRREGVPVGAYLGDICRAVIQ